MRLLILGLDNSGKTTIVGRCKNGVCSDTVAPTLGFNIVSFLCGEFVLNCWDIGGQRSLRAYWKNYFEQTDALVWVVDCGDAERLEACAEELHALLFEERLAGASLLILANKQDLDGALSGKEVEKALGLHEQAQKRHYRVQPCSAFTGEGLQEGIEWLVNDVAQRIFTFD